MQKLKNLRLPSTGCECGEDFHCLLVEDTVLQLFLENNFDLLNNLAHTK